jgi:Arc/MetJ-type ribon-helix-helix transcriptional regulator
MKTMTFRLPEELVAELDAQARRRGASRSDVVREGLEAYVARPSVAMPRPSFLDLARDLVGSVVNDGLPADLSAEKKRHLKELGYGQKRDCR